MELCNQERYIILLHKIMFQMSAYLPWWFMRFLEVLEAQPGVGGIVPTPLAFEVLGGFPT